MPIAIIASKDLPPDLDGLLDQTKFKHSFTVKGSEMFEILERYKPRFGYNPRKYLVLGEHLLDMDSQEVLDRLTTEKNGVTVILQAEQGSMETEHPNVHYANGLEDITKTLFKLDDKSRGFSEFFFSWGKYWDWVSPWDNEGLGIKTYRAGGNMLFRSFGCYIVHEYSHLLSNNHEAIIQRTSEFIDNPEFFTTLGILGVAAGIAYSIVEGATMGITGNVFPVGYKIGSYILKPLGKKVKPLFFKGGPLLTYNQFTERGTDPCILAYPKYGNFATHWMGTSFFDKVYANDKHFQKFKKKYPSLDGELREVISEIETGDVGAFELYKPHEPKLYDAYRILKRLGVSDMELFC